MAVSHVPGSRKSLNRFGYAGLQAHRKRRGRNPRLEALEDRAQPQSLNFMATPILLAMPPMAGLAKPQAAVHGSAHATPRSIATTAIASASVAAQRGVHHGSAGQQSPALVQAAAPRHQRHAAAHLTSATHQGLTPPGHRAQVNAQPSARSGGAAVSAAKGGRARSRL